MKGEHKEKVAFIIVSFMAVNERKQTNNAGGDGQADGQKLQKRVPWAGFSPGIFCSNMITEKYVGKGNDLQCIGQKLQNVENEENRFFAITSSKLTRS